MSVYVHVLEVVFSRSAASAGFLSRKCPFPVSAALSSPVLSVSVAPIWSALLFPSFRLSVLRSWCPFFSLLRGLLFSLRLCSFCGSDLVRSFSCGLCRLWSLWLIPAAWLYPAPVLFPLADLSGSVPAPVNGGGVVSAAGGDYEKTSKSKKFGGLKNNGN